MTECMITIEALLLLVTESAGNRRFPVKFHHMTTTSLPANQTLLSVGERRDRVECASACLWSEAECQAFEFNERNRQCSLSINATETAVHPEDRTAPLDLYYKGTPANLALGNL